MKHFDKQRKTTIWHTIMNMAISLLIDPFEEYIQNRQADNSVYNE
jgi:hypothetical protein